MQDRETHGQRDWGSKGCKPQAKEQHKGLKSNGRRKIKLDLDFGYGHIQLRERGAPYSYIAA